MSNKGAQLLESPESHHATTGLETMNVTDRKVDGLGNQQRCPYLQLNANGERSEINPRGCSPQARTRRHRPGGKGNWFPNEVCSECKSSNYPYHAKGLCKPCYRRLFHLANLEDQRRKGLIRMKEYYTLHREKILNKEKIRYLESLCDGNALIAFERDGWKCTRCGALYEQSGLVPHHKDGRGCSSSNPNHDPENLETLCQSCHAKLHYDQGNIPPLPMRGSIW